MRKLVSVFMLLTMILSILPVTNGDFQDTSDQWLPDVSGTRATVNEDVVTITSGDCTEITGNLYYPSGVNLPAVVFGVGYVSIATNIAIDLYNSSNYRWLATHLAENGYAVLVVRYCVPDPFENPMDFINFTNDYSLWVQHTKDSVTALVSNSMAGASVNTATLVDEKRIALGGHSIGGAVAIVAGATDKRIKCVFGLAPKDLAGTPKMDDYIPSISPMPIQLQVGELDQIVGSAEVSASYNAASAPKQMVEIRYGTYEGFTDLGDVENIQLGDIPTPIQTAIAPYLDRNPLTTRQQDISKNYTRGFLDYYLKNEFTYDFISDYSGGIEMGFPPLLPTQQFDDVWHASVDHDGLYQIFFGVSASPSLYDFAVHDKVNIRARIAPKGIWETGVEAELIFGEGTKESYSMDFFDPQDDISGGDFRVSVETIPISHSLGTVTVNITATDNGGEKYTASTTFELITSSGEPEIDEVTWSPDPMAPDETITFTIDASDPDGDPVPYYLLKVDNVPVSGGWVETNRITYTFTGSGNYQLRFTAKDDKAAESNELLEFVSVSSPPTADLEVDTAVRVGEAVEFDASGSSDPDGDNLQYFFVFGDGRETGWIDTATTEHRYDTTGEMVTSVKVRDDYDRVSDQVEITIKVKEKEDDSFLSPITSSSGFPIIILVVIVLIIGGWFFVMKGEDEEEKKDAVPTKVPSAPKPMKRELTKPSPLDRKKAKSPLRRPIPRREMRTQEGKPSAPPSEGKEPEARGPMPGKEKPSSTDDEEVKKPKLLMEEELAKPVVKDIPRPPDKQLPLPPEPEIDAPAIPEESWDDEDEEESDEGENEPDQGENEFEDEGEGETEEQDQEQDSGGEGREPWEDEDFAIPVALKDKLKKESE